MKRPPRLAMSSDFLSAFARLPKPQQGKCRKLIFMFNSDPAAPGLNYELIRDVGDSNMRSLRIDKSYRAIVVKPRHANVHVLLWADKHDDAYDWAARHECRINPETGALQVYAPDNRLPEVQISPSEEVTPWTDPEPQPVFQNLKDRQLTRLGVPTAMLAEVRTVRLEDDLDVMKPRLPVEAYESLFLYLAGESYEKLVLDRELAVGPVDPDDFSKALDRIESRTRFVVVKDEMELEEMLNAPLERWRVFLHSSQRRLVERHWQGPVRVLGGAGTGKTVVAMHRARWLARNAADRGRILFVTFTRNLATDIENNLRSVCSPAEMACIEVTNLDRWVTTFLRQQNYDFRVIFGRHKKSWQQSIASKDPDLNLSKAFYEDEWIRVVQANGITSEADYLRVPRVGRGTPLMGSVRARVWPVFAEYRAMLAKEAIKEIDDAYADAAALLSGRSSAPKYATIIVDEAQDMGTQSYHLIRSMAAVGSNDLFIVGDGHQRIYGRNRVVLSRCGINIRGRSRKLCLNYRTTEETRRWAARLLEGRDIDDLDGGLDENRGFKSLTHGPDPHLVCLESQEKQAEFIGQYLSALLQRGTPLRSVCIVARTRKERNAIAKGLDKQEIKFVKLEQEVPDDSDGDTVRLATMHRVKGLEFDHVVMASINRNLVPLPAAVKNKSDDTARESAETEERALVYVAATRAKKELLVISWGRGSRFLE